MVAASREIKLPIPEAVYSTKKRGKKPRDAVTRRIAAISRVSLRRKTKQCIYAACGYCLRKSFCTCGVRVPVGTLYLDLPNQVIVVHNADGRYIKLIVFDIDMVKGVFQ